MLFVKDMLFCSSVMGEMAPDLDLFGEIAHISMYFATKHGEKIATDVGIDPREREVDLTGVKASMGITDDRESITMRELEERRKVIRDRMMSRKKSKR